MTTLTRLTAWTLLLAAGFAILPDASIAQDKDKDPPLPSKSNTSFTKVKELQEKARPGAEDIKQGREHMKAFAQYYADFIAHPLIYRVVQDPSIKLPPGVFLRELNIDERIAELGRYLLEPHPRHRSSFDSTILRVTTDNVDYINEMGKALDDALIKVVKDNPNRIVKVNAMRMYVAVCKSGAPAHWPTVTALLTDPKTRTEIKVFALQAAANLLWAYDLNFYQSRRHSIGSKQPRDAADKEIGALVKAIEDCITKPTMLVPDYPDGKDPMVVPTANQLEVVKYARREAIRALAQVRFVTLPGPEGKAKPLYPAHTLARVCMADPTLGPTPTPSEFAEAVMGICNMAPVWDGSPVKEYNADAAALAVAKGIVAFATPRTDPENKELAWTGYALRLSESLKDWPPLFSFLHNPLKPNPDDAQSAPPVIKDLISRAQSSILTPLSTKNGKISLLDLDTFIKTQEEKPNSGLLFTGVPQTTLLTVQKK